MSIKAEIIADSISPRGHRLTTFVLEFPRWILAELNTHRMFSRNVASSRAIPTDKMMKMIDENPAEPSMYGKNQSGMQSEGELTNNEFVFISKDLLEKEEEFLVVDENCPTAMKIGKLDAAKLAWKHASKCALYHATQLNKIGLHKQYTNRLIENFTYVRAIVSATEFENFFALRAHKDAQPEIQLLAYKMLEEYNKSQPKKLNVGEWHIPFGGSIDEKRLIDDALVKIHGEKWWENMDGDDVVEKAKQKIAIARCARISYFNFEGKDDYEADIKLCDRLFGSIPRHLSPAEHVAQATDNDNFIGNFRGFKQYRYFFLDQNLKDDRVKK